MCTGPPLEVKVWGEFACFTRPEMKVERVSYPVMTPSAARGVLEAIFWKPEFSWQVREIYVLNEIRHFSILRNEVNSKASAASAKGMIEKGNSYFAFVPAGVALGLVAGFAAGASGFAVDNDLI